MPKNKAAGMFDGLGDDAKVVAANVLTRMAPGEGTIEYGTSAKIHPWARAALDELVAANLVSVLIEPGPGTAGGDLTSYRPLVDFRPLAGWGRRNRRKADFGLIADQTNEETAS